VPVVADSVAQTALWTHAAIEEAQQEQGPLPASSEVQPAGGAWSATAPWAGHHSPQDRAPQHVPVASASGSPDPLLCLYAGCFPFYATSDSCAAHSYAALARVTV